MKQTLRRGPDVVAAFFVIALSFTAALAQVDKGCSPTVANPCTSSGSGGGSSSGGSIWSRPSRDKEAEAREKRLAEAHDANEKGVALFNNGHYAEALALFKEAHQKNPDSEKIKNNLAAAQEALNDQLEREAADARAAKASAEAAKKMTASMQNMVDSMVATPSANGLEFGDMKDLKDAPAATTSSSNSNKGSTDPCKQTPSGLTFGDPNVVDTRCAKQPLPRVLDGDLKVHLDDAITGVYKDAPAGVEERVRKAFQAITDNSLKDSEKWPLAELWLKDALKRDPKNQNLIKLLDDVTDSKTGPKIVLPDPKGLALRPDDAATNLNPDKWATYYIQNEQGNLIRVPDKLNYGAIKAYYGLIKGVSAYAPKWVERPSYIIGTDNLLIRVPKDYNPLKPTFVIPEDRKYFNPTSPLISIVDGGQIIIVPFARGK